MNGRFCYMIVTKVGAPVLLDYRLPIYWLRRTAVEDARRFAGGAQVVRIPLPRVASSEPQP